ncbi:MAG: alpha/beta fold hydrolase [Nocardioides sp.]
MDLVPKPPQVLAAAGNVAHSLLYGGVADLRPMPRTLVADGLRREVYHYRPDPEVSTSGDPVLLVTPLAAPSLCFDLRRGCSLVEHLVQSGRPTYLVEYGEVSFADRALGLEHWIDDAIPAAITEGSEHAGGRPVHVVGWSLGGIFALLAAADRPDLPIASLAALGTPFDVRQVPIVAPLRPLLTLSDWPGLVTKAYQAMGGVPKPLVAWAFQLSSFQKLVTRPLAVAAHLDDTDYLAQLEAVDRFTQRMTAYPGRTFGQLYHRFLKGNALLSGELELAGRTISMASLRAPTLVFAGNTDGIAPVKAVQALLPLLTGAREARFEIVPGGHLGMLTGRAARVSTWRALDGWFGQWDAVARPTRAGRGPAPGKKPAKRAARATATTKAGATTSTPIGTNRARRFSSAGSRALRP